MCLLSAFIMLSVSDLSAQTRKTTGARKTTSATKKPAVKANISGTKYIGMASFPGQPIDLWVSVDFAEADANMSLAGSYSFDGKYTATTTGATMNVSIPFNEKIKAKLKSSDKGGSMEGTLSMNGTAVKLWMVKIPSQLKQDDLSGENLEKVFSASDGYTALVKIQQGDGLLCVPADFTVDAGSKNWQMKFDNAAIQKMFGTSQGSYSVSGTDINMTDSAGLEIICKSYDNGNYLEAPMGSAQGMTLTLILIR